MPSVLWVSLPLGWKLEEVQAGLQVIIALLCTWGIFAFSRFCWQLSSLLVKKNHAVALASLMSINTIGEAFDVVSLLKRRIFRQRYWKLLAQSIVVVALTVATIVSGPIAKASTRVGSVVRQITMPGYLATRSFNSRISAAVDWNETYNNLERASFPYDQLLDYLPHTNETWLYKPEEWNNSWTMDCKKTENTPISIVDTGICGNWSVELPATNKFFAYNDYDMWATSSNILYGNSTWLEDGLLMLAGWTYGFEKATNRTYNMTVVVASLHIHNGVKKPTGSTSTCDFGRGPIESASYSKMECFMKRPRTVPDGNQIAFPDHVDWISLPQAYTANYYDRMVTEANTNKTITVLTPTELIRFYQTYIITKDYQYRRLVNRLITADLKVVQVSSTFIAFGSLYALLVVLGLINYGFFAWKHRDVLRDTPESKLDWIVQSILDESEVSHPPTRMNGGRKSVVAPSSVISRASEKVRAAFENAKYGATSTSAETTSLTSHAAPQAGSVYSQAGSIHSQALIQPDGQQYHQPSSQPGTPGYSYSMSPPVSYSNYATEPPISPPIPYANYAGELPGSYTANPYDTSYLGHNSDQNVHNGLQNPPGIFTSDRRRGYQRLG